MGGGGGKQPSGGFTWDGGDAGSVKPDKFNQQMIGDITTAYGQGPTFQGMGSTTQQGLQNIESAAQQGQGMFKPAIQNAQGLLSSGGLTGDMQGNIANMQEVGGRYDQMFDQAGQPSLTEQTLMGRATGGEMANNPYLDDIVRQTNDNTYADVMASLGGRTGSNIHMETLGGALADNESRLRYGDYNNALSRQMEALGAIEGQRQTGVNNQFGALSGSAGAAQAGFGMGQQGISNTMGASAALPGLFQASLLPGQTMAGVGGAYDQNAQAQANAPFQHLAQYQGLLGGAAQTAEQTKETPWWQQALGAASIGSGIFGNVAGGWSDMGWT